MPYRGPTPDGLRTPDGLVPYRTPGTGNVTANCLEPHDLWISKAVAGRPKDREFCRALIERNIVKKDILHQRLKATRGLDPAIRRRVRALIDAG